MNGSLDISMGPLGIDLLLLTIVLHPTSSEINLNPQNELKKIIRNIAPIRDLGCPNFYRFLTSIAGNLCSRHQRQIFKSIHKQWYLLQWIEVDQISFLSPRNGHAIQIACFNPKFCLVFLKLLFIIQWKVQRTSRL